jgi:hypothetical protein
LTASPSPAPSNSAPTWELLPAARGSGYWLCALTYSGAIALAAPGVALDAGSGEEDLTRWRCGSWSSEPIDLSPPNAVITLSLRDVAKLAGPEWEPWLLRVTDTLIRRTVAYGFASAPGMTIREARAQRSQAVFELLAGEASEVFPQLRLPGNPLSSCRRFTIKPKTVGGFLDRADRKSPLARLWRRVCHPVTPDLVSDTRPGVDREQQRLLR